MAETVLTPQIAMVLLVILGVIILFISELVRVDVVAIMMMVILPMLGLVTPHEAFVGLSSNAVVSIIAVIIIGAGLDKTGIMNQLAAPIVRFGGDSYPKLIAGISGAVAAISSFMQNIGAAALFLPATMRVSKQLNIPLSRLLMPMGYCAILGGTVTMVGSSPLIVLNDLMANSGLEPFGLFSVTPIGIMLVVSGITYFVVFGNVILPSRKRSSGEEIGGALKTLKTYAPFGHTFELMAPEDFAYSGKTIEELQFRSMFLINVIAIAQAGSKEHVIEPSRNRRVNANDTLAVIGHENSVRKMADHYGFVIKPELAVFRDVFSSSNAGLLEAVVAPMSSMVGATLRQAGLRSKFLVGPVALYREGKVFMTKLSDIELRQGDTILLHGTWDSFARLKKSVELIFPVTPADEAFKMEKTGAAVASFAVAIGLVLVKDMLSHPISLSVCLMTGASLMVLTRAISIDEAYKAVDWRTVFLLAGLIPLGIATEKSGTAAYISHGALTALGEAPPLVLMTIIAILATGFTMVISNVGATVLLVPLAIHMANETGADPRTAALVVGLATSNSFLLPTHQVNALLMGPGGYRTADYIRAGGGMTIIFIMVTVFGLWAFYGI